MMKIFQMPYKIVIKKVKEQRSKFKYLYISDLILKNCSFNIFLFKTIIYYSLFYLNRRKKRNKKRRKNLVFKCITLNCS